MRVPAELLTQLMRSYLVAARALFTQVGNCFKYIYIYIYIAFLTRFVFLAPSRCFFGGVWRVSLPNHRCRNVLRALRVLAGSAYRIPARPPRDLGRTLIVGGRIFTKNMYTWS